MNADHTDKNLKVALSRWRGIEARPGFEERVWKRIQTVEVVPEANWSILDVLRGWTELYPAYARAAMIMIGGMLALALIQNISSGPSLDKTALDVLRPGSISGSYVQMLTTKADLK